MLVMRAPRRLWVDFLEPEAYIHSHSANNVYHLDGKVSEMYMSEETADISYFCKLACYNWIMYRPDTIDYPNEKLHPRKSLGPTVDVGLSMTTKIVQHNGEVLYKST